MSTILGAAGIVGLAIGFAVRDTVENFIASIMLSVRQPFRPNDAVEINGDEGKVIHLTSRATVLLSFDGNHIRIPNATVFKSRIVNYSRNAERRFLFDIGVAPDTDLSHAHTVAEEVLGTLPFLLATPAPAVWTQDVGDSTITLRITGWIDQTKTGLLLAKGETIRMILARFGQAGIEMPNPDLYVANGRPGPAGAGCSATGRQTRGTAGFGVRSRHPGHGGTGAGGHRKRRARRTEGKRPFRAHPGSRRIAWNFPKSGLNRRRNARN